MLPGCRYFNIAMSRLSDHLRRRHGITLDEHEALYNSCKASAETLDHIQRKNTKHRSVFEDFIDTLPGACRFWERDVRVQLE